MRSIIKAVKETTKEELKQIYYINKEIQMWQRELERLRSRGLVKSPVISDMPRGGINIDIADYASEIADYEAVIRGLLAKAQIQRKKIMDYIDSIDDSLMKQIIFYRHISCMTWNEVACAIGGNNTEGSVKMAYNRFFKAV